MNHKKAIPLVGINHLVVAVSQEEDMMKNRKLILPFLITFITLSSGACKTVPTRTVKGYTDLCQSIVDQDVKRLIDQWGQPQRTLKISDGHKVYVYREIIDPYSIDETEFTALMDYPPFIKRPETTGDVTGGFYFGVNCVTFVEANKSEKIVKVFWKGDCRAEETE